MDISLTDHERQLADTLRPSLEAELRAGFGARLPALAACFDDISDTLGGGLGANSHHCPPNCR